MTVPEPTPSEPLGPWIDLSHDVGPGMPCASIFPTPAFTRLKQQPKDPFTVTEMRMAVHSGTHVDAPSHFFLDGPAFEAIPLDRLHGPGVVLRIHVEPDALIDAADLERGQPEVRAGDIVAVDTGWADRFGTDEYDRHPSLTVAAAQWLVDRRVKLFACDFATPDLVYHLRAPGFDWPVHRVLLSHGVLVCEHLKGHAALAGGRAEFIFGALKIRDCDGAPARVLARRIAI